MVRRYHTQKNPTRNKWLYFRYRRYYGMERMGRCGMKNRYHMGFIIKNYPNVRSRQESHRPFLASSLTRNIQRPQNNASPQYLKSTSQKKKTQCCTTKSTVCELTEATERGGGILTRYRIPGLESRRTLVKFSSRHSLKKWNINLATIKSGIPPTRTWAYIIKPNKIHRIHTHCAREKEAKPPHTKNIRKFALTKDYPRLGKNREDLT